MLYVYIISDGERKRERERDLTQKKADLNLSNITMKIAALYSVHIDNIFFVAVTVAVVVRLFLVPLIVLLHFRICLVLTLSNISKTSISKAL